MNLSTLTTRYGVDAALRTLAEARTLLGSSADLTDANTAGFTVGSVYGNGMVATFGPAGVRPAVVAIFGPNVDLVVVAPNIRRPARVRHEFTSMAALSAGVWSL